MSDKRSDHSSLKALVFLLTATTAAGLLMANRLGQADPQEQGRLMGGVMFNTLIPAIVVALISRRSGREFGWLRFGACYFAILTLLVGLAVVRAAPRH